MPKKGKIYPGYVVMNQGDTLHGKIRLLKPSLNEIKVKFINPQAKTVTYKSDQIRAYGFQIKAYDKTAKKRTTRWIRYIRKQVEQSPIPFGPKLVLLECQAAGEISFYRHFIEAEASSIPLRQVYYLEKYDMMVKVDKENYRGILTDFVEDFPILASKVGTKGYRFAQIPLIVNEYNQWGQQAKGEVFMDKKD